LNARRAGLQTRASARSGPQPGNHSGEAATNPTATLGHRRFVHRRSAACHQNRNDCPLTLAAICHRRAGAAGDLRPI